MIRIAAYTSGGLESASSRLRSFYLFHSAADNGVRISRDLGLLRSLSCNQLHLQKCYTPLHLTRALAFRCLGKQVVFDIDDQAGRWSHKLAIIIMMRLASMVTTDTEARAAYCARFIAHRKIVVIPDVLDVDPERLSDIAEHGDVRRHGIFWTGHRGNLDSIAPLLDRMQSRKDHRLVVATHLIENDPLQKKYPTVKFVKWAFDCAFDEAHDVGYMILNHGTSADPDSMYKSENKMVLAIAAGLIPVVSRTPAYSQLARTLNAERLIFEDLDDVFELIRGLEPAWVADFLAAARKYVVDNYSAEHIFRQYMSRVCGFLHVDCACSEQEVESTG